jgi:hypothetical protein
MNRTPRPSALNSTPLFSSAVFDREEIPSLHFRGHFINALGAPYRAWREPALLGKPFRRPTYGSARHADLSPVIIPPPK